MTGAALETDRCEERLEETLVLRRETPSPRPFDGRDTLSDAEFGEVEPGAELGAYRVVETLARGGMGSVFRVEDRATARKLALKAPRRDGRGGSHSHRMKRFLRETRLAARMDHPGVAKLVDSGQQDGLPYYTMEIVDGAPLSDRLATGPLGIAEAIRIVEAAARAAHHVHEKGVVHRDLKPQNILVRPTGEVVIIDLGLARDTLGVDPSITQSGIWLGTPAYISPEQARGEASTVDARTDVYSLGAVLYEALTGFAPYGNGTPIMVFSNQKLREAAPVRNTRRECPAELDRVVMKALAKDREDRFESALAFAEALAALARSLSGAGKEPTRGTLCTPSGSRLRRLAPSRESARSWLVLGTPAVLALAGFLLLLL